VIDFFSRLTDTSDFPPRWYCGNWSAGLGWLHVGSDAAIAGAYFAIPCLMGYFILRRRDVPFLPIFWLFVAFILSCGVGHAVEATLFWHPWYRLSGLIKLGTAVVSWATVVALIPALPMALHLPGLAAVNRQLRAEIARREQAERERADLATQMLQAQKLESLGLLAGGIAHDFNNILTGVMGYVDLARLELPPGHPAVGLLDEAAGNCQRAADLAHQMLAYAGQNRLAVETLDLSTLVADTRRLLDVSVPKKCAVRYDLPAGLPACEADPTQLSQVVVNLVVNAGEAVGNRAGEVCVRTAVVDRPAWTDGPTGEARPAGKYLVLEVADTGCGMSADTRGRLFDPFFSTKFVGRGLGLASVLGIVRGHKGGIEVDSEVGRGSAFRVYLPATDQPAGVRRKPPSSADRWRGDGLVLVVDDEPAVRGLAAGMLGRLGFEVLTADNGRAGADLFAAHADRVRLVVLDLMMPTLDGYETLAEVRKVRADVPAVLSTGYDAGGLAGDHRAAGFAGLLHKPFRFDELSAVVRAALGGPAATG
jgi:signal transduction histidine kinase/ActR/RegA family two-component response regulator